MVDHKPDINSVIGRNVKKLRKSYGLSAKDLGILLGVTYQQVNKYESGVNRLSSENMYHLAQVFKVPYEMFFTECTDIRREEPGALKLLVMMNSVRDPGWRRKIERVVTLLCEDG